MPAKLRTIIRDPQFEEELKQLIFHARRADEFVEAVEFLLARDPERGLQARPGSPVWTIPVQNVVDVTPVIIYYTFNEEKVILLSIQETIPPEE